MHAILIRYQFNDPNPIRSADLVELLKQRYGGAVNFVADGTVFLDTRDDADIVFNVLNKHFTFDDKLFVGELKNFQSLHNITRVSSSMHKLAI